ncbi:PSP1 domain-containing protein [Limisalsivibrio acetivorans]|uniref:PSP1 domain-containing protein n=1 Tax=Limisalsivibrio acetivorans TaxID=1304888 RepID=UPI0003B5AD02|nr:stage 0 sporulation family protein [Limisalsivibrio acetivorans]
MKEIEATGVSFKPAGKIYDFLSAGVDAKLRQHVVVETEKGEDIAQVVLPPRPVVADNPKEMKRVIRLATEEDLENAKRNKEEEPKAFKSCKEFVVKHELEMKLLKAEYTLDRSKLTFFFTADGRVDFRALVRDLARVFRTRIEMRQVGVRDATKMLGGFGLCGKEFCCSTFLRKFDNISIKMAKDQNLILNPTKISGVCGRLMCCLLYEKESYDESEDGAEVVELKDMAEKEGGDI